VDDHHAAAQRPARRPDPRANLRLASSTRQRLDEQPDAPGKPDRVKQPPRPPRREPAAPMSASRSARPRPDRPTSPGSARAARQPDLSASDTPKHRGRLRRPVQHRGRLAPGWPARARRTGGS
jgi:hypothetical protein